MLIAVVNSKGGVGKSTLAVHAAVWLRDHGLRVAFLDADAQNSSSEWLSRAAPDIKLEQRYTSREVLEQTVRLQNNADVVVADGPAAISNETAVLSLLADLVLIPVGPSMMDVNATIRTARLVYKARFRRKTPNLPKVFVILNRLQPRTRLARITAREMARYGFPLAPTAMNLRQAYADACGRGTVVWRMGADARPAAVEMALLFRDVLPFHKPSEPSEQVVTQREARAAEVPAVPEPVLPAAAAAIPAPNSRSQVQPQANPQT